MLLLRRRLPFVASRMPRIAPLLLLLHSWCNNQASAMQQQDEAAARGGYASDGSLLSDGISSLSSSEENSVPTIAKTIQEVDNRISAATAAALHRPLQERKRRTRRRRAFSADDHAPYPLMPHRFVANHLVAASMRGKSKTTGARGHQVEDGAGRWAGPPSVMQLETKKEARGGDEESTGVGGEDSGGEDENDPELVTLPLSPLKADKLWEVFKDCGWRAPKALTDDDAKKKYLDAKFRNFVGRDIRTAFSSPPARGSLPRDLSTRSKRTVFVRILHEQADLFCESLVSEETADVPQDVSQSWWMKRVPPPQWDRHVARKPRFIDDKCIKDIKEVGKNKVKQKAMVCRQAFGEDLGKYVLANSHRAQDLKRKWKGKKLSKKDLTDVKSLASLPMFGSGAEEVFYTTPDETESGVYCGMTQKQVLNHFYKLGQRENDAQGEQVEAASGEAEKKDKKVDESETPGKEKSEGKDDSEEKKPAEGLESEDKGAKKDKSGKEQDGEASSFVEQYMRRKADPEPDDDGGGGKSGGDDKSEKGGGKDDAGGKESDERHDPDGFYDIGDYESSCKDMCPDQKEGEAQALKEAKGKKEVIADGLWTCVSILRNEACKPEHVHINDDHEKVPLPPSADCFIEYLDNIVHKQEDAESRTSQQLLLPSADVIEDQLELMQKQTAQKLQESCQEWLGQETSIGPVFGIGQVCDNSVDPGAGNDNNEFQAMNSKFSILERKSYHDFLHHECEQAQRKSPIWFLPSLWNFQSSSATEFCSLHRVQARQARIDFMIREFNRLPEYLSKTFIAKVLLNELDDDSVHALIGIPRPARRAQSPSYVTAELLSKFREVLNRSREKGKKLHGEEHLDVIFARFLSKSELWPQKFFATYVSPAQMAGFKQRKALYLQECKKLGLPLAFRDDWDPNSATGCTRETIKLQLQLKADEYRMNKESDKRLEDDAADAAKAHDALQNRRALSFPEPTEAEAAAPAGTKNSLMPPSTLNEATGNIPIYQDYTVTGTPIEDGIPQPNLKDRGASFNPPTEPPGVSALKFRLGRQAGDQKPEIKSDETYGGKNVLSTTPGVLDEAGGAEGDDASGKASSTKKDTTGDDAGSENSDGETAVAESADGSGGKGNKGGSPTIAPEEMTNGADSFVELDEQRTRKDVSGRLAAKGEGMRKALEAIKPKLIENIKGVVEDDRSDANGKPVDLDVQFEVPPNSGDVAVTLKLGNKEIGQNPMIAKAVQEEFQKLLGEYMKEKTGKEKEVEVGSRVEKGNGKALMLWRDDGTDRFSEGDPGWMVSLYFLEQNLREAEKDLSNWRFRLRDFVGHYVMEKTKKRPDKVYAKLQRNYLPGTVNTGDKKPEPSAAKKDVAGAKPEAPPAGETSSSAASSFVQLLEADHTHGFAVDGRHALSNLQLQQQRLGDDDDDEDPNESPREFFLNYDVRAEPIDLVPWKDAAAMTIVAEGLLELSSTVLMVDLQYAKQGPNVDLVPDPSVKPISVTKPANEMEAGKEKPSKAGGRTAKAVALSLLFVLLVALLIAWNCHAQQQRQQLLLLAQATPVLEDHHDEDLEAGDYDVFADLHDPRQIVSARAAAIDHDYKVTPRATHSGPPRLGAEGGEGGAGIKKLSMQDEEDEHTSSGTPSDLGGTTGDKTSSARSLAAKPSAAGRPPPAARPPAASAAASTADTSSSPVPVRAGTEEAGTGKGGPADKAKAGGDGAPPIGGTSTSTTATSTPGKDSVDKAAKAAGGKGSVEAGAGAKASGGRGSIDKGPKDGGNGDPTMKGAITKGKDHAGIHPGLKGSKPPGPLPLISGKPAGSEAVAKQPPPAVAKPGDGAVPPPKLAAPSKSVVRYKPAPLPPPKAAAQGKEGPPPTAAPVKPGPAPKPGATPKPAGGPKAPAPPAMNAHTPGKPAPGKPAGK